MKTKKARLFDIQWDFSDEDELSGEHAMLPTELVVEVPEDWNAMESAADFLSERNGYCVAGLNFEELCS